jgi:hypothetical protein
MALPPFGASPGPIPRDPGTDAPALSLVAVGYVVMPEHVHLLLTEPKVGSPSTVMQVLKQRTAARIVASAKTS